MKNTWFLTFLIGLLLGPLLSLAQLVEQPDPLRPSTPDSSRTKSRTDSAGRPIRAGQKTTPTVATQTAAPQTPIYRYRFAADGTLTAGNVSRALLQLAGALDYEVSRQFKLSTNPSFVYGQQNGLLAEREWFDDFRTTYRHEKRLYYLAFGSFERSNLRRINRRWTVAGGAGYKLVNRKRAYLSVTNVVLQEFTDFVERSDINLFRNSTRLFGDYTFGRDRWTVTHTAFYQPALQRRSDGAGPPNIRWNGTLSVQIKLTTQVSLRSTLANAYESIVAPGRRNNDLRFTVGVMYEKK